MLTQERLKELLHYNSDTGIFTWKKITSFRTKVESNAGTIRKGGYIRIAIDGNLYYAHRLAFLYIEGYMPENNIDHIDRNPSNNRWDNLREISQQCNTRNCSISKNNTSGIQGVIWHKKAKKWAAQICIDRTNNFLGVYENFDNAVCARLAAEQCFGWAGCDSNSTAFQHVKNAIQKVK